MRRTKQVLVQALAKAMHDARKEKGFTQSYVASQIGISQGALSKMERGLLVPSAIQWVEFCRLTKIRLDGFMPAASAAPAAGPTSAAQPTAEKAS